MSTVWLDMPDPPPGRSWCIACAMFAKAQVNNALDAIVAKLNADGKDEHVRVKPSPMPHLEPSSARGLCTQLQQLGIIDLCWTHLAGVEIQVVSPLDPRFNGGGNMTSSGLVLGRG